GALDGLGLGRAVRARTVYFAGDVVAPALERAVGADGAREIEPGREQRTAPGARARAGAVRRRWTAGAAARGAALPRVKPRQPRNCLATGAREHHREQDEAHHVTSPQLSAAANCGAHGRDAGMARAPPRGEV